MRTCKDCDTHQEIAQDLSEEHVGELGQNGVGAWSGPFHFIAQQVEDRLQPAAESTRGNIQTQDPREQTQPAQTARQRIRKDETTAHQARAGSAAAVDERGCVVGAVFSEDAIHVRTAESSSSRTIWPVPAGKSTRSPHSNQTSSPEARVSTHDPSRT